MLFSWKASGGRCRYLCGLCGLGISMMNLMIGHEITPRQLKLEHIMLEQTPQTLTPAGVGSVLDEQMGSKRLGNGDPASKTFQTRPANGLCVKGRYTCQWERLERKQSLIGLVRYTVESGMESTNIKGEERVRHRAAKPTAPTPLQF